MLRIAERLLVGGEIALHSVNEWEEATAEYGPHVLSRSKYTSERVVGPVTYTVESAFGVETSTASYYIPERFSYQLSEVVFDPATGVPWIEGGDLLAGVSQFGTDPRWSDVAYQWTRSPRDFASATTVIVAPNYPNFYHFLIEEMPAFLATLRHVQGQTTIVMRSGAPKWVHDALDFAGITAAQLPRVPMRASLYAVSTRSFMKPSPEDWTLLRTHFLPRVNYSGMEFGTRIFLSRVGYQRSPMWEIQLQILLRQSGWEVVDPAKMPLNDQITLFQGADIVAGISGAALSNIVWMRPGSTVVTFGPPDPQHGLLFLRLAALSSVFFHVIDPRELDARDIHEKINLFWGS